MEQFIGTWKLIASENFDEYMKAVGIRFSSRQIANLAKPSLLFCISEQGVISMQTKTTFKTVEIKFRLDEEFDEITADDRKAKTVMKLVDDKLVQTQTWEGKSTTIERDVQGKKLTVKCVMDDVVSIRTYERDE